MIVSPSTLLKMTASDNSERWLARRVITDCNEYGLSLVKIYYENDIWKVDISPYSHETPSTSYYSGTIKISKDKDPSKKPLLDFF